ncbi:hypothetical protein lbkm_2159 [Lachnospiraceae bacterium KM106-2]|nr:hypothetical protein lbkm_2159 [Lachnospiraceae bacterium KM106-2]
MISSLIVYEETDLVAKKVSKILGCIVGNAKVCGLNEVTYDRSYRNLLVIFSNEQVDVVKRLFSVMDKLKTYHECNKTIVIECGGHPQYELYFASEMDDYYFILNKDKTYEIAAKIRETCSIEEKQMPEEELKQEIYHFLKEHNTGALATGINYQVRCTPIEYLFFNNCFYLISEGGMKFSGLLRNDQVSFSVFESYSSMNELMGMQVSGKASVIERDGKEFLEVFEKRGYLAETVEHLPIDMHIIKIVPNRYEFLCSDLKKKGYASKQIMVVNENHSR